MTALTARLGLGDGERAVLITADDFGLCHAATMGVLEALRAGAVTSAGLLVPAPWARDAAARAAEVDVGVHLALTAGLPRYRWGPVTIAPSLLGGDGGFPATVEDLHDHADPDEVRRECLSQLERAALFGIDPTHLSVHDGALFAAPALFDVLIELAEDQRLPLRLPDPSQCRGYGYPLRDLAAQHGVVGPDWVRSSTPALFEDPSAWVASLDEGVTELVVRPSIDSDELRALAPDADERVADLDGLLAFGALGAALLAAGVRTLSWSELRDVARGEPVGAV